MELIINPLLISPYGWPELGPNMISGTQFYFLYIQTYDILINIYENRRKLMLYYNDRKIQIMSPQLFHNMAFHYVAKLFSTYMHPKIPISFLTFNIALAGPYS
jgi:hypothetical protein